MLRFEAVQKGYRRGSALVPALKGVSFDVGAGEFLAVVGPSGSGKSTLLHLSGALDAPTQGEVFIGGTALSSLNDAGRTALRRSTLGFVFQFFNLLPTMTALENAMMPALLAGISPPEAEARALALLTRVGLEKRAGHRPDELSGGEMQRIALSRALVTKPRLLLADEPTGNLDSKTGAEIFALLRSLASDQGTAIVMVTHDPSAAARADRVMTLKDGLVVDDRRNAAGAA